MARKRYPGKFEGVLRQSTAEVLHRMAGEGMVDEELGDVQGFGWYGLFDRGKKKSYIVSENNQGFFDYAEFTNGAAARKQWAKIEQAYEKFEEGVE